MIGTHTMLLLAINRTDSSAPSLEQVGARVEVPVLKVCPPDVAAPVDPNVLLPVAHIDLMGDQPQVFPSVVPNVSVNVVNVSDRLCSRHQEIDNSVLEKPLITKIDSFISGGFGRLDQLPILGAVVGVIDPKQFSAARLVLDAMQKISRYLSSVHINIIPFQQGLANYG